MPIIEIHVLQGYDAAQKTRLCKALTNAARTVIPATPDAVTVMIKEMPATDYISTGRPPPPCRMPRQWWRDTCARWSSATSLPPARF